MFSAVFIDEVNENGIVDDGIVDGREENEDDYEDNDEDPYYEQNEEETYTEDEDLGKLDIKLHQKNKQTKYLLYDPCLAVYLLYNNIYFCLSMGIGCRENRMRRFRSWKRKITFC